MCLGCLRFWLENWSLDLGFKGLLREALRWLYARIGATCQLPDPLSNCQVWVDLMKSRPGVFKGFVKRAKGLEQCRITCFASLQALGRLLQQFSCGQECTADPAGSAFPEAGLICKRGFQSRAAWACHASKKHGYRIAASLLASERTDSMCSGCGRQFANQARLRRHLLHADECRIRWVSFLPSTADSRPEPHCEAPPIQIAGSQSGSRAAQDPAGFSRGLFQATALDDPTPEQAFELVVDFVEPLDTLRATVCAWCQQFGHRSGVGAAAEDVLLMLDPEVFCESFCRNKPVQHVAESCPELPGPFSQHIPFVLSGPCAVYRLDLPPSQSFCHPFVGGAPLAAAKKQAAFLEAACDLFSTVVQQASISRVKIVADRRAFAAVEPAATWLLSVGFCLVDDGMQSPVD